MRGSGEKEEGEREERAVIEPFPRDMANAVHMFTHEILSYREYAGAGRIDESCRRRHRNPSWLRQGAARPAPWGLNSHIKCGSTCM